MAQNYCWRSGPFWAKFIGKLDRFISSFSAVEPCKVRGVFFFDYYVVTIINT